MWSDNEATPRVHSGSGAREQKIDTRVLLKSKAKEERTVKVEPMSRFVRQEKPQCDNDHILLQ